MAVCSDVYNFLGQNIAPVFDSISDKKLLNRRDWDGFA